MSSTHDVPTIVSYLNKIVPPYSSMEKVESLIEYSSRGGKQLRQRILSTISDAFGDLDASWACDSVEILQTALLILDDISDRSTYRRGGPCLYKTAGVKCAMSSGWFLIALVRKLALSCLSVRYPKFPNKGDEKRAKLVNDLVSSTVFLTALGQSHDTLKVEISSWSDAARVYNLKNYKKIVSAKTSQYSLYMPMALAYVLNGRNIPDSLRNVSCAIGEFMQYRDDYINFLPEVSGKSSTDLEEKKVTFYTCKLVEEAQPGDEMNNVMKYLISGDVGAIMPRINMMLRRWNVDRSVLLEAIYSNIEDEDIREVLEKVILPILHD